MSMVDGPVALLVPDDTLMGTPALIVVLGPDGQVLAKAPTEIGG